MEVKDTRRTGLRLRDELTAYQFIGAKVQAGLACFVSSSFSCTNLELGTWNPIAMDPGLPLHSSASGGLGYAKS